MVNFPTKDGVFFLAMSGFLLGQTPSSFAASGLICDRVVEDFSGSTVGSFPAGWRTRSADEMPKEKSLGSYRVVQDGARKVLHAVYRGEAITIGAKIRNWDLKRYPILQWDWKAAVLPAGADERSLARNDSAASVYSIWEVGFPFYVQGVRYSWSSTAPVGTHVTRRLNHDHVFVRESGSGRVGDWQTVQMDVRNHRKTLFPGSKQTAPDGVALLTDADATSSRAEAYYANFRLCRRR